MANLIWTLGPTYQGVSTSWKRELVYGTTNTSEEGIVEGVTLTFTVRQSVANTNCKAKIRLFKTFNFSSAYAWSERTTNGTQSLYAYISPTESVPSSQYYSSSTADSFTSNILAEESVTLSKTDNVSNTFTITLSKNSIKQTSLSSWSGKIYFGLYLEENPSNSDWLWQNYTTTTLTVSYSQESTASFSPSVTLGQTSTITINRKNDSFTHTVTWKCGGSSHTLTGQRSSASFLIPENWATNFPNDTSYPGELILTTYSGSTQIGNAQYYDITYLLASSIIPTVSSIDSKYSHDNDLFSKIIGSSSIFTNRTTGTFTISGKGIYGSTITEYEARADSTSGTIIGQNNEFFLYGGNTNVKTIYARVKDSRGKWSDYKTLNLTRVVYSPPSIVSLTSTRTSDSSGNTQDEITGSYGKIICTYKGGTSPIGGTNNTTCTITVNGQKYPKTTTGDSSSTHTVTGFTAGLDTSLSYTVTLTDTAGSSVTKTEILKSVNYLLHFRKDYLSLGIGCAAPSTNNQLNIAWETKFIGNGYLSNAPVRNLILSKATWLNNGKNNETHDIIFERPDDSECEGRIDIIDDSLRIYAYDKQGNYSNPLLLGLKDGHLWVNSLQLSSPLSAQFGGTGYSSLRATRNAMGLGNTTGALPVANGGTGANDGPTALQNLGIMYQADKPTEDSSINGKIWLQPITI